MMGDIRGKKVADLCSAPGGKTFQLISKGAKTTAFDRSENRIKTLKENLERLNLKAEIINQDCKKWLANNDNDFDIILLDAPCSATGTIRKNPDVMINKKHSNILEYAKTQKQLLNQATKSLKKGGVLYYCVCSIQPEEGQAQIDKILKENKKLERLEFTHKELEQKKAESLKFIITEKGDIRILPFYLKEKGGMDGFFLARIARRK
jgi:16S rRNA (cytosine967-C5)-methyltransferase